MFKISNYSGHIVYRAYISITSVERRMSQYFGERRDVVCIIWIGGPVDFQRIYEESVATLPSRRRKRNNDART